jgi:hypothetical protein
MLLEDVTQEKDKFYNEYMQVSVNMHDLENNYQNMLIENSSLRESMMMDREHLEGIIKEANEKISDLSQMNEIQEMTIIELKKQIEEDM